MLRATEMKSTSTSREKQTNCDVADLLARRRRLRRNRILTGSALGPNRI